MSHIIEALKRAREEGTKKSEKGKGFKLSNILTPAGKSGKKFKLSKNTILIIASGLMFLFAFGYTMKPYLKKRREIKDLREKIARGKDSKDVPEQKLQIPEPPKKEQPEVKTLARQLPQVKEFVPEVPAPEQKKKELQKLEPQKKEQPEVKALAQQLPQAKEFVPEIPAPEQEKKELRKPEVKTLARQLPQSKEPVSRIPASEHKKDDSEQSTVKPKSLKSPIYHFNLGTFYQGEKKLERAKEEYEQVIRLEPFNVEAHNNLGMVYKNLRKFDKAIAEYKKAIALDPQYQKAYYNLAVVYYLKGDIKSATTEARLALALSPDDLESYNILSISYKKMNNHLKAMETLQNALLVDSSHAQTHYNFALLLEEVGRIKDATFHYRKFIDFSRSEKNHELVKKVKKHLEQIPLQ